MSQRANLVLFAAFLTFAFVAGTARADLLTGSPKVCGINTPGGPTRHAYWCSKYAATATARSEMARNQNTKRWFAPTYCDPVNGDTLRWNCLTFLGGDRWTVTVWFRGTADGWKRVVTVTKTR